jgi:hypothetical protein
MVQDACKRLDGDVRCRTAALRQKFTGAAQHHYTKHHFVHKWALQEAETQANATMSME